MSGEGPHNSLHRLFQDAYSRIEKREKVALAAAVMKQGISWVLPRPFMRSQIRAFYGKLKDGLNEDYCTVLGAFTKPDASRSVSGVARTDGPSTEAGQRIAGRAKRRRHERISHR